MDKFKKLFNKNPQGRDTAREDFDALLGRVARPVKPVAQAKRTNVDTELFAKAVVQEFGETLVLLGKE